MVKPQFSIAPDWKSGIAARSAGRMTENQPEPKRFMKPTVAAVAWRHARPIIPLTLFGKRIRDVEVVFVEVQEPDGSVQGEGRLVDLLRYGVD